MKKLLFFTLITLMTIFSLFSCVDSGKKPTDNDKNTSGTAHYNTINIIVNGEVLHTAKYENNAQTTPFDLLVRICQDKKIEYAHLDGYVNSVSGYNNTADRGWLYFFNNQMPDVGASDYKITKGYDNTIDFKYMKYSEAFSEQKGLINEEKTGDITNCYFVFTCFYVTFGLHNILFFKRTCFC